MDYKYSKLIWWLRLKFIYPALLRWYKIFDLNVSILLHYKKDICENKWNFSKMMGYLTKGDIN